MVIWEESERKWGLPEPSGNYVRLTKSWNRNFLNYLEVDHTVSTVRYGRPVSPTAGLTWWLSERSDWGSVRTGQNHAARPIPALWYEHSHDICTQLKHVGTVHWLTESGQFSVQFHKGVEWNVWQWSKRHKTATFSPNPHILHFDINIHMISAH